MAIDWPISDSNPKRKFTREELKDLFSSWEAMKQSHRFVAIYVKYDYGLGAWPLWTDKLEAVAHQHILKHYDGNLYGEPNKTRNGESWDRIVKCFYFD